MNETNAVGAQADQYDAAYATMLDKLSNALRLLDLVSTASAPSHVVEYAHQTVRDAASPELLGAMIRRLSVQQPAEKPTRARMTVAVRRGLVELSERARQGLHTDDEARAIEWINTEAKP